jgi:nicotinate-nucleotide pyrophosphorylase (carboxylating)
MATKDFRQIAWDDEIADDCRHLVRLAVREDLDRWHDWTSVALVAESLTGKAIVVPRKQGVIAGLAAAPIILEEYDRRIAWHPLAHDGEVVDTGATVAELSGPARSLLAVERPLLNLLGHLSGIASSTRAYVAAVAGTGVRVYDTRKTTPGWRRLEKYAVRCGGGTNHRLGLFDAVLIKDNHLALCAAANSGNLDVGFARESSEGLTSDEIHRIRLNQSVKKVRDFLEGVQPDDPRFGLIVEVEVDTMEQLDAALSAGPDIVLLDNFRPAELRAAVARRNLHFPKVELEASGGIDLTTIREVAETGVERISVGALTHSANWFDVGLDWVMPG